MESGGVTVIVVIVLVVVVFLVCREIMCWYWKINEAVGLLKEIRDRLSALNLDQLVGPAGPATVATQSAGLVDPWGKRPCPHCGKQINNNDQHCIYCNKEVPDLTKG